MITARSDTPDNSWQYDDSARNYLYSLLDDTVYSPEKKLEYERTIQDELTLEEFKQMEYKFRVDAIDSITMRGAGKMWEIKNKLKNL